MESFSDGGKRWLAAASIKMSRNVKAHILHHISLGTQNPACHGNINKITPSHKVVEACGQIFTNFSNTFMTLALILYLTFQFVFEEWEFVSALPGANVGVGAAGAGVLLNMALVSGVILWSFYFHPNLGHQRLITERPRPAFQCFLCHLWIDKRWVELQRERGFM